MTTVLTWEPRRLRLHSARAGSAAILALTISFGLQIAFLVSFLPSVLLNGSTDGADGSFWLGLAVVMARTSVITAAAAVLAMSLATAARNTAFAIIALFAWLIVVEGLIRSLTPSLAGWLWGESVATSMNWSRLENAEFGHSPLLSAATLVTYLTVIVAAATISFQRRDITAAT
jgi:hypothetical protein